MKLSICLVIVAVTISNAFEINQHRLIGAVKIVRGRSIERDDVDPASICATAQKFTSFCSTNPSCDPNGQLFQCLPNGKYSTITCKNQKPYCVGSGGFAFCSSEPDATACAGEFYQCLGNGLYPELNSCRSYYNCSLNADETAISATRITCDRGFVFNPNKGCTRGFCNRPACRNNKRTMWRPLNYLGFDINRMGLLCVAGNPTFIYSCPNNMRIDMDSTSEPKCILRCTFRTQIAPSLDDNTKFLKCVRGKVEEENCQPDFIFDADQLKCVKPQPPSTTTEEPTSTTLTEETTISGTNPTESTQPSSTNPSIATEPSTNPSSNPSIATGPSTNPNTDPTITTEPSTNPSTNPSIATDPSTNPSTDPTTEPSTTDVSTTTTV